MPIIPNGISSASSIELAATIMQPPVYASFGFAIPVTCADEQAKYYDT